MELNNHEFTVADMLQLKPKFLTIIRRYQITSFTAEDILGEFFYKMLRVSDKDGKNYLTRYNGTTTRSTWFYRPLQNLCFTLKTRENSKGGQAVAHALTIQESPERETEFDGTTLYLENFESSNQTDLVSVLMARQLLDIAKDKYSGYHSCSSKGVPRSIFTAVKYLYAGLTKAQIARSLEVSPTFIDSQLKKFMNDKEVLAIKAEYAQL